MMQPSNASILRISGLILLAIFSFVNHIALSKLAIPPPEQSHNAPFSAYQETPWPGDLVARLPQWEALQLSADDALLDPIEWDMSPIVIEEYKLIFFTQPKVGCTVFKQLFRRMTGQSNWMSENCCGKLPWNPATNGLTYLSHYNATEASRMLQDPTFTKAIFVRDPVTRFLSAYLDKAVQNPFFLRQKCSPAMNRSQQQSASRMLSMEEFFQLAQECDNPHWRSQVRRLPKPEYWNLINFVGYLESAREDTERLLRKIGVWESFGASGWGDGQAVFEGSTGRQHATSAASKRNRYIRPELEARLRTEFYAEDYQHPVFARYAE